IPLDRREFVDVAGIEDQRLFADGVHARPQRKPAMGVVQIVRRADRHIVDLRAASAQLIDVTIEQFELGEEFGVGKVAVHDAHGVVRIIRHRQFATGLGHRAHVPRSDVAGSADQCVSRHEPLFRTFRLLQASYRTRGESNVTPKPNISIAPAESRRTYAAAIRSAPTRTRTLRPSKFNRTATRW
ncbi:hypothetical protein chiPu_0030334, partial [Chiloscyllium punctatum]|nr:hypothetical protein [Chiloscyllium punctatum]